MRPRPFVLSLALILTTLVAGLALRFAPLSLPQTVTKYGGSALWAIMIYCIVSTLLPSSVATAAIVSGLIATSVELFKLVRTPTLDAFRLTLPGILLLGRFFSPWDLVAYWLAISVAAFTDTTIRNRLSR